MLPDVKTPGVIAVVGPFRSGTSCVAGMLHTLGVSMGREFPESAPINEKGFYECQWLRQFLAGVFEWPELTKRIVDRGTCIQTLTRIIQMRTGDSDPFGVKHPLLCLLVPEMAEAYPGLKIVSVNRDMDAILKSAENPKLFPRMKDKAEVIGRMIATRDADAKRLKIPVLSLNYSDVLANPSQAVSELVAFTGIESSIDRAAAFVDPQLCHNE